MKNAAEKVSLAEFKREIDQAREAGTLSVYRVSCQFLDGEAVELGLAGFEDGMGIEEFYTLFLDSSKPREVKIYRKDRSERGYARYKILLPMQDGGWSAAIEITRDVDGAVSMDLGGGVVMRWW